MKIVINKCYGGFGLSPKAIKRYLELQGKECFFYKQVKYRHEGDVDTFEMITDPGTTFSFTTVTKDLGKIVTDAEQLYADDIYFYHGDLERTAPILVQVVEELGADANGWAASLHVADIPDGISWYISDYDGIETIHEKHRSW